jgi:hypothetical protein
VIGAWLRAFLLTQLVEVPIYRYALPTRFVHAFAASTITHPIVWFVFPWISDRWELPWTGVAVAAEIFAWAVEAAYFAWLVGIPRRRAAVVSLVANGASVAVGLALRAAWGIV